MLQILKSPFWTDINQFPMGFFYPKKRDYFNFDYIINFPFFDEGVPRRTLCGVYISHI